MANAIVHWVRAPFLFLAPEETASTRVLPVTLLLRPLPVAALLVLVANDQWLKHADLMPAVVTGKLSDVAGLFFAPLLAVTLLNMVAWAVEKTTAVGLSLRSPSLVQVALCCAAIGVVFTSVQVNVGMAQIYRDAMDALSFWSPSPAVVPTPDPTDLVALVALLFAFFYARGGIAVLPPGRLAQLEAAAASTLSMDLPDAESALLECVKDVLAVVHEDRVVALETLCDHVLAGRALEVIDLDIARLRGEVPLRSSPIA